MRAPARSKTRLLDLVGGRLAGYNPGQAWVSDITCVRTGGWLVADALGMATARQGRTAGIVFDSDRGSQYLAGHLRRTVVG